MSIEKKLRCPECQQRDSFVICSSCNVIVSGEGDINQRTEPITWGYDIDATSPCECLACAYCGQVKDFQISEQEKRAKPKED